MISVLIPVFNYSIVDLVTKIHKQLQDVSLPFEVICFDDNSGEDYIAKNKTIEALSNSYYKLNKKNIGRTQARQTLANMAKYNWLLFLDADVMPKSKDFVLKYTTYLNKAYEAIFGGFAYKNLPPEPNKRLRWSYGRQQEQKSATSRNQKPYKIIISANFLIKKEVFLSVNNQIEEHTYGLDNIFGSKLKQAAINVYHIDNEVYHLGIESNISYLKKKEDSAIAVLNNYKANKLNDHQNDLLNLFVISKRYGFNYVFVIIYKLFNNRIKKNLTGSNPSIKLLQLYRISFMCYKDLKLQLGK